METTPTQTVQPTNYLKVGLAWAISLLFIFILIYVISKAWKKGQTPA
jgi:hypothetical protein